MLNVTLSITVLCRCICKADVVGKFFFTLGMRAKTRYDNGTLPNCFAKQLWDQKEKHNLTDQEVGSLSGGLFGAGSDTSSATMTTFMLAMTVYGDKVLPKAQEELDRVVGRNRSPTWSDEENLPYIRAVVKEAFRWRPVAVLGGTPHANTEDDYYNGYFIPKGSTILGLMWGVLPFSKRFGPLLMVRSTITPNIIPIRIRSIPIVSWRRTLHIPLNLDTRRSVGDEEFVPGSKSLSNLSSSPLRVSFGGSTSERPVILMALNIPTILLLYLPFIPDAFR